MTNPALTLSRFNPDSRRQSAVGIGVVLAHAALLAGLLGAMAWRRDPVRPPQVLQMSLVTEQRPSEPARKPSVPQVQTSIALPALAPVPIVLAEPVADATPAHAEAKPATVAEVQAPAVLPLVETPPRFDAAYLNNPPPAYPAASRQLGEAGRVLLSVRVGRDGNAIEVGLRQSSGYGRLDRAAAEAVRRWRFVPARRGDEAVEASVLVPIDFKLN
jgi:protein TonB